MVFNDVLTAVLTVKFDFQVDLLLFSDCFTLLRLAVEEEVQVFVSVQIGRLEGIPNLFTGYACQFGIDIAQSDAVLKNLF